MKMVRILGNLDLKDKIIKSKTEDLRLIKALRPNLNTGQAGIVHALALMSAEVPLKCMVLASTLTCTLLSSSSTALCATNYVRSAATGANSGGDWNNAYTGLPATLVRGDTYYVADGTYGSQTFSDNASGSTYIYIKKATVADHGTSIGWSDSFGTSQAVFSGTFGFGNGSGNSGYYDINGYSATAPKNCGIKISFGVSSDGILFPNACGSYPYCNFRYLEVAGPAGTGDYAYPDTPGTECIWINSGASGDNTSHMLISHCYIHGGDTGILNSNSSNGANDYMTVEYCELCDFRSSNANNHDNVIWLGSWYWSSGTTFATTMRLRVFFWAMVYMAGFILTMRCTETCSMTAWHRLAE